MAEHFPRKSIRLSSGGISAICSNRQKSTRKSNIEAPARSHALTYTDIFVPIGGGRGRVAEIGTAC